jgi:hypothetical protein
MHTGDKVSLETSRPIATFQHPDTNQHFYVVEDLVEHPFWSVILPHIFEKDREQQ